MDRFFLFISRMNSVILLLLLIGGGLVLGVKLWSTTATPLPLVKQSASDEGKRLRLEEAEKVGDTDTYYAVLVSDADTKFISSGPYGRVGRNILFIQNGAGSASWLFPANAQILRKIKPLPEAKDAQTPSSPKALYMEVVSADTDGDGGMGWSDAIDIAFTKPDGTQFTKTLAGVSRVLAFDTAIENEMRIIYQIGTELWQGQISLDDFKLLSSQRVAAVPESL
ncbi:hypothetical protein [Dongia sp.]|uniref:hypothetical protein n=1 Tax=Dongia sp. TaxID=1977262 RepID=UPI0035B08E8A